MNLKQNIVAILLLLALPVAAQTRAGAPKTPKPFTVVIDAGHGGHDPGALGKITQEKKLNLDVSLLLGKMIEEECEGVQVRYTRKTDVFLTLQERANFVNKNNADLFICIHTNASKSSTAVGAETFVLGIDKMASNLDVAMRENAVMLLEENYETVYQGFDPNSIDSYIMFELMQDQYIDQSLQFATNVQQQFSGTLKRADRGVRQAGFWVLHKSACPSVLIEMGFISNPDEEIYLASKDGKQQIATALYNAFVNYKNALDRKNGRPETLVQKETRQEQPAPQPAAETSVPAPEASSKDSISTPESAPQVQSEPQIFDSSAVSKSANLSDNSSNLPARSKQPSPNNQADEKVVKNLPVYRVQIFAVSRVLKPGDATFKGLKNCKYTQDGKFYKYTYGETENYTEAVELQKKIRDKFPDSFVVAFLDGKQILVKDARNMK